MGRRVGVSGFTGMNGKFVEAGAARVAQACRKRGWVPVILRDSSRTLYLRGSDLHDSRQMLIEDLRARMADCDCSVFVGGSAGGFGALDYGTLLDADLVVGFGAFTRFDTAAEPHDPRGRQFLPRLWTAEPDDSRRSMAERMEGRNFSGAIVLHFPEGNLADRFQAESLAEWSCTRLVTLPGEAHNMFANRRDAASEMMRLIRRALREEGLLPRQASQVSGPSHQTERIA